MSNDIAIRIENLGKRYRYGGAAPLNYNLRADITDWVKGMIWLGAKDVGRRTDSKGQDEHPATMVSSSADNGQPITDNHSPRESLRQIHERHIAESPDCFWALKDISIDIKRGEVVGIIGRNGAGKSTLLKVLSRITPPTIGKVTYRGRVASLLEVGTGFHRELTGRENIYLNGSILGMKRAEIIKKLDEIVAFAEVDKFIDTPVKFYSSGMYVRLAFAVAAHLQPDILLVDEVLAVGDMAFQAKCLGRMGEVAREGITVLFVSHNMSAIEGLCRKAIVLKSGKVDVYSDTASAISRYVGQVTQGSPPDIDLSNHSGRDKDCLPIFQRLRLLSPDGTPCSSVRLGESIIFEFTLLSTKAISDAPLYLCANTELGIRILTVSTRFSGVPVDLAPGVAKVIRCRLDECILVPGCYPLSLVLYGYDTLYDEVHDVATLTVEACNYYGGGELPASTMGLIVSKVKWE